MTYELTELLYGRQFALHQCLLLRLALLRVRSATDCQQPPVSHGITLRAIASCGAVYCNRSCLWVCDSGRAVSEPHYSQRARSVCVSERIFHSGIGTGEARPEGPRAGVRFCGGATSPLPTS